jgi:hypothetical protein
MTSNQGTTKIKAAKNTRKGRRGGYRQTGKKTATTRGSYNSRRKVTQLKEAATNTLTLTGLRSRPNLYTFNSNSICSVFVMMPLSITPIDSSCMQLSSLSQNSASDYPGSESGTGGNLDFILLAALAVLLLLVCAILAGLTWQYAAKISLSFMSSACRVTRRNSWSF